LVLLLSYFYGECPVAVANIISQYQRKCGKGNNIRKNTASERSECINTTMATESGGINYSKIGVFFRKMWASLESAKINRAQIELFWRPRKLKRLDF
jgi:hypothetical protein